MASETVPPKWMPRQRFWTDSERDRLIREHGEMAAMLERLKRHFDIGVDGEYIRIVMDEKAMIADAKDARALLKQVRNA